MEISKTIISKNSFPFKKLGAAIVLTVFSTGCTTSTGGTVVTASTVASNAASDAPPSTALLNEVELLKEENRNLIDRIELIEYEIKRIQSRQIQLYEDLDLRLRELERNRTSPQPATTVSDGHSEESSDLSVSEEPEVAPEEPVETPVEQESSVQPQIEYDPQEVRDAYDGAFRSLREGRYEDAIVEFQALIDTYPGSELVDDALYWIGEANYVTQNFEEALPVFERVLKEFPTAQRAAESMLKMGYIFYDLEDYVEAQNYLMEVINRYPASRSAFSARRRLDKMERDGLL